MAETQIEWTDATWNPVAGCTIVSAGCTNCYAMEMARRLQAMDVEKYKGLTRRSGKRTIWNGVVREDQSALDIPLRWKKPKKIFVNSMSDLFHERVSDAFILNVWNVMRATPHHHYQILTKRPDRMGSLVAKKDFGRASERLAWHQHRKFGSVRQGEPPTYHSGSDPLYFVRAVDWFCWCNRSYRHSLGDCRW